MLFANSPSTLNHTFQAQVNNCFLWFFLRGTGVPKPAAKVKKPTILPRFGEITI
jgi:hypothetical protein